MMMFEASRHVWKTEEHCCVLKNIRHCIIIQIIVCVAVILFQNKKLERHAKTLGQKSDKKTRKG